MYSKTSDKLHLHGRAGSHATKGSGRGTVWWEMRGEIEPATPEEEFERLLVIMKQSGLSGDRELKKAVIPRIQQLSKELRAGRKLVRQAVTARRIAAETGTEPSQVEHPSALAFRRQGLSWIKIGMLLGIGAMTAKRWAAKALLSEFETNCPAYRDERARWFRNRPDSSGADTNPLITPLYPSVTPDVDDPNDISFRDDAAFARLANAEAI